MKKIPVAVLGATGNVGQRFIQLLDNHPWFQVVEVCASEASAGKKYGEATCWKLSSNVPQNISVLEVKQCKPNLKSHVVFSALDSSVAGEIETNFANAGYVVISNSRNHRMDKDVPLLIPEVNPEHLEVVALQKRRIKKKGFIVTNPNCTTVGLTMVLKPLHDKFGIQDVLVSSFQALSGAGYPGVPSLDALDNVIPYISGEEEKIESEPLKLLAKYKNGVFIEPKIKISAHCNRVSVRDGHLENLTISFKRKPSVEDIIYTLENFKALPQELNLPSAPVNPIVYRTELDRPQPYLDRDTNQGMSVTVGRVRKSNVLDIRLSLLVHNTIRGAAGGAILNAELVKKKGLI